MRGRSSRAGGSKVGMEVDKVDYKVKDETHLSGAYIRSLVKQLTSSRNKDPLNPKDTPPDTTTPSRAADGVGVGDGDGFPAHQNSTKFGEPVLSDEGQQSLPVPPQQHKKQVRRRLHTSRPYQERLLNMAEARREIVTALKFHRAAMKQANEQQLPQQQQQSPLPQPPPQSLQQPPPQQSSSLQSAGKTKSRRNPRIYPSSSCNSNFPNFSSFCYSSSPPPPQNPYSWPPNPHQIAPPAITENLNLALPNQPLGLNLNIHDFNNLDATLYHNPSSSSSSICSWSPSSSSTSLSPTPNNSVPMLQPGNQVDPSNIENGGGGEGLGLHLAMDDEEMAEMRSMGEKHQMEWNDTMSLVTSAWWFKFFKTSGEIEPPGSKSAAAGKEDVDDDPCDQVLVEFPSWLNANEESSSCFHQHYFMDHLFLDDYYSQDPALPCMDIGEIEGMDGEWLS